ncbi:MAG: polysaccharide biosynthesis/export family protein [Nitrospirota bacterium]
MNKFLIQILFNIFIVQGVLAQELPSFAPGKMPAESSQFESFSNAQLEITPILPGSFTSRSKVSFKISNVGFVSISSFILQVNLIDIDDKVIWEGVKTFGHLEPDKEITAKFHIPLDNTERYKLRYILIYANKEIDEQINIPVSVNMRFNKPRFNQPSFDQPLGSYTIGPLDILEIFVIEDPDLRKTVPVAPDGRISFPVIGNINVLGITPAELSEEIASLLGKDYLVNPRVTVSVIQSSSKKFSVMGEVERPGVFSVNEGVNLLKAIALSGGFTKFADLHNVTIFRKKDGQYEIIKIDVNKIIKKGALGKNITICPEDIIIVPESLF